MSDVYLNGKFMPLEQARISPMDRGFLFADGVYEVFPVYQGVTFGLEEHLQRLKRSMDAISLEAPYSDELWHERVQELVVRNGGGNLLIYLQVTRGEAEIRDHGFPDNIVPTVFMMASKLSLPPEGLRLPESAISAVTLPDLRWSRCDIKSIALLPNILSRQAALENGADEAILVRENTITECAAANVFLVKNGIIVTPALSHWLLGGITRDMVIEIASQEGFEVQERTVLKEELFQADEIWITSSSKDIMSVGTLDGKPVGLPSYRELNPLGKVWKQVASAYLARKQGLFGQTN